MKKHALSILAGIALLGGIFALGTLCCAPANAYMESPKIGKFAPSFTTRDTNGNEVDLKKYLGKIVVLEWTNNECPFVRKHYDSKNMQTLQKEYTAKGVIWLSIVSSANGKQGNVTPKEANEITKDEGATITAKILDEHGVIGHAYNAKTTPSMFIIGKDMKLAYMGAIDDQPSPDPATIKDAKNYVRAALDELLADKNVTTAQTESYGCSVKY